MSNYVRVEDFSVKDGLTTGDPEKTITGADIDSELDAIVTAISTKEDSSNKGSAGGYCGLDGSGLVAASDLPTATTSAIGALEIATDAEAVAGTATDKILVPSNIDNILAEPPAIGGTTAAAISGTTGSFSTSLQVGGTDVVLQSRTVTAGAGMTGGGDLTANITLDVIAGDGIAVAADSVAVDISGLTSMTVAPDGADSFLYHDADAGTMKQMTFEQVALPSNNAPTSRNFAAGDVGHIVYWTGTSGTLTMVAGIGQDDCWITVVNSGSGTVTLAGSGVTLNSANSLLDIPAGGMATLIRESSGVWFAGGSLQ